MSGGIADALAGFINRSSSSGRPTDISRTAQVKLSSLTANSRRKWTFLLVQFLTLAAVVWYACLTQKLVKSSNDTFAEARDARQPWVGIERNEIIMSPTVDFFWGIPPHLVTNPTITVSAKFSLKNFGQSPALYETDAIYVMGYHDGLKPIAEMKRWCQMEEELSKAGAETSGAGEMLLPGATKEPTWTTNVMLNPGQTHIERLWVFVCLAYQDPWKKKMHYSRYMYLTRHQNLGTGTSIPVNPKQLEWTYIPITGANLFSAEAD
jgi:hypothetical protein